MISTIKPSLTVIPFPLLQIELTICVKLNCLLEFYDGSVFYKAKAEIWRSFVGLIIICCKWVTFIKILGTLEVTTDAKIEKYSDFFKKIFSWNQEGYSLSILFLFFPTIENTMNNFMTKEFHNCKTFIKFVITSSNKRKQNKRVHASEEQTFASTNVSQLFIFSVLLEKFYTLENYNERIRISDSLTVIKLSICGILNLVVSVIEYPPFLEKIQTS